jgi:hypothetical protein
VQEADVVGSVNALLMSTHSNLDMLEKTLYALDVLASTPASQIAFHENGTGTSFNLGLGLFWQAQWGVCSTMNSLLYFPCCHAAACDIGLTCNIMFLWEQLKS